MMNKKLKMMILSEEGGEGRDLRNSIGKYKVRILLVVIS
jgi:hypothetical protein